MLCSVSITCPSSIVLNVKVPRLIKHNGQFGLMEEVVWWTKYNNKENPSTNSNINKQQLLDKIQKYQNAKKNLKNITVFSNQSSAVSMLQGMIDGSTSKPAVRQDTGYMVEKTYYDIAQYTIPMNDIFNLNSTILPENLEVFYSTLPCQP